MGATERRRQIMYLLCRRRHETIENLSSEFGVSTRTISRDIQELSSTEPIYTQAGSHGGGVYVMDDYYIDRMYMSAEEISLLKKFAEFSKQETSCVLTSSEKIILKNIIGKYEKPTGKKERKKI